MKTGAFDIAWQHDDLDTEPYILEVSPFYQPNPKPYKNMVIGKKQYQYKIVMFNIQKELINNLCKQFSDSKMMES